MLLDKLIPTWNEKYSIHNTMIDIQHQNFVNLQARLKVLFIICKTRRTQRNFNRTFNYMKEHFSNEEDYMQEIHYPYLNEHKIMHKISFVICLILYKT